MAALRRGVMILALFIALAGCSHAARVSVMSSATHDRQTANIRSLLERQKPHASSSTRPKAQAMAAAVATSRPRSSQQGSISARDNKEAQINRERTLNDDRPSRDHLESGATRVSRQSTSAAADSRSKLSRQAVSSAVPRQGPGGLDFGAVPTLDLSSGLENMQSDLSGLVTEFKQQGGFWKEGSLQDNISNMVQLGVKGALGLVSPIVNGLTGGIPITVPSVNGKCIQGKPIRSTSTGLFGSKKRVTKCLIGTGSQVADYLSKAAGSLAGMAGEVLEKPATPAPVVGSETVQAGTAVGAGDSPEPAVAPVAGQTTDISAGVPFNL